METLSNNDSLTPIFSEIETILGKDSYEIWLRPVSFDFTDQTLTIQIPNQIWQKTIQTRYEHIIKDTFLKHTGTEITISYIIKEVKDPVQAVLENAPQTPAAAPVGGALCAGSADFCGGVLPP